jgi:putative transposase
VPPGDLDRLERVWFSWERLPPSWAGFRGVLPRTWVVERSFSWLGQSRRLSKDYERLCETSEHVILIAMIRLMSLRLVRL